MKLYGIQCLKDGEWVWCWNAGGNPCIFADKVEAEYDLDWWKQDKSSTYRLVQGKFVEGE